MKQINKKYKNTTAVANKLAEENVNIVYKVLYDKFRGMAHDTIISVAMNELLDAAYRYDFKSAVKFTTYAYSCIYFKLLEALKKEKVYRDNVMLTGDFTNEEEMTKEIKSFLTKHSNTGGIDVDYDGLQVLEDLGLYEMSWEDRHQELAGGKHTDYKQQKVIKREEQEYVRQNNVTSED